MTPARDVTVTHLVMESPRALRPSHGAPPGVALQHEALPVAAAVARECYRRVGAPWHWTDRAEWPEAAWAESLAEVGTELWTARAGASLVGFFLLRTGDGAVEVQYFGLVPEWIGRRVGGWLLTEAVRRAWAMGAERVVLSTCSLDGPAALPNYLARGFSVARTVHEVRTLPG